MTQSDLALVADSSTRHLSYLETGRSQPSRDMILRLSEHLGIPLRAQNTLLLAAGFAPAFEERSLAELASARVAIEQILKAHKPNPTPLQSSTSSPFNGSPAQPTRKSKEPEKTSSPSRA